MDVACPPSSTQQGGKSSGGKKSSRRDESGGGSGGLSSPQPPPPPCPPVPRLSLVGPTPSCQNNTAANSGGGLGFLPPVSARGNNNNNNSNSPAQGPSLSVSLPPVMMTSPRGPSSSSQQQSSPATAVGGGGGGSILPSVSPRGARPAVLAPMSASPQTQQQQQQQPYHPARSGSPPGAAPASCSPQRERGHRSARRGSDFLGPAGAAMSGNSNNTGVGAGAAYPSHHPSTDHRSHSHHGSTNSGSVAPLLPATTNAGNSNNLVPNTNEALGDLYRRVAETLVLKSARFGDTTATARSTVAAGPAPSLHSTVAVTVERHDIAANAKRRYAMTLDAASLAAPTHTSASVPVPCDNNSVTWTAPSGRTTLVHSKVGDRSRIECLRTAASTNGTTTSAPLLRHVVAVTFPQGAVVCTDPHVQNITWDDEERVCVVVADTAKPKRTPWWESTTNNNGQSSGSPTAAAATSTSTAGTTASSANDASPWESKHHWGETMLSHSALTLYAVDTVRGTATPLLPAAFSEAWSAMGPVIVRCPSPPSQDEAGKQQRYQVLFSAIAHSPRRLGLVYCRNRNLTMFAVPLPPLATPSVTSASTSTDGAVPAAPTAATPTVISAFAAFRGAINLKVLPDALMDGDGGSDGSVKKSQEQRIAFLGLPDVGSTTIPANHPHNGCYSLHVGSVAALLADTSLADAAAFKRESTILDVVTETPTDADTGFHGIYPPTGDDLFWVGGGRHLLLNSVARSGVAVFKVDIAAKSVAYFASANTADTSSSTTATSPPTPTAAAGQTLVADVSADGEEVLLHTSTLLKGSVLQRARCCDGQVLVTMWVADPLEAAAATAVEQRDQQQLPAQEESQSLFGTEVIRLRNGASADKSAACPAHHDTEAVFFHWKAQTADRPTVVFVHGGPHSTDTCGFSIGNHFLLRAGCNVLTVNYGGSLGFGHHQIQALMGAVGRSDVDDCKAAVEAIRDRVDPKRLVIAGGSHGGFLTAHLTGQFPTLFAAAVMRNPVVHIAASYYETDIPDWTLAVAEVDEDVYPLDDARMTAMSPVRYMHQVQTPTLVALGLNDLRVRPTQGTAWFHGVRRAGTDAVLLEYDANSHPLDGVHAMADFNIQSYRFISKYL